MSVLSNESTTYVTEILTDFSDQHENDIINSIFVVVAMFCLVFSGLSLVAINRTQYIPQTACFLSSTLIIFDCATTFTYAVRKLVTDSDVLNTITLIGLGWSYASFINVAVMVVERLVVFQWPYFYMRHVSHGTCMKLMLLVIVVFLCSWTTEWAVCFTSRTGYWNTRSCYSPVIKKYMTATFATLAIVTTACFIKIGIIIRRQRRKIQPNSETSARNMRSTIVVFLCCVNYFFTAVMNLVLVYTAPQISIVTRRTIYDVLYMLNGLTDTCVYILWYKESRYELFKILSALIPSFRQKVEQMRIEILDLGTTRHSATADCT